MTGGAALQARKAPEIAQRFYINMMYSQTVYITRGWIFLHPAFMPKSVFSEPYRTFIATLVALRTEQRMTQVELAQKLGKPQQFVSRFELGIRRLDVVEFYAVARALGVDPSEAFVRIVSGFPGAVSI